MKKYYIIALASLISFTLSCAGTQQDPEILSFSLEGIHTEVKIDNSAGTVNIKVPWNIDLTDMIPLISYRGMQIIPRAGISTDFSSDVIYTVTAETGNIKSYTVSVSHKEYQLGEKGPSGGWIFYINTNAVIDQWKYLECALTNTMFHIYHTTIADLDAKGTNIGDGLSNTLKIIGYHTNETNAAYLCNTYSVYHQGFTYDDWFLPSLLELEQIYLNLHIQNIGNFNTSVAYWSSSQCSDILKAWTILFANGMPMCGSRQNGYYFQPVRRF